MPIMSNWIICPLCGVRTLVGFDYSRLKHGHAKMIVLAEFDKSILKRHSHLTFGTQFNGDEYITEEIEEPIIERFYCRDCGETLTEEEVIIGRRSFLKIIPTEDLTLPPES